MVSSDILNFCLLIADSEFSCMRKLFFHGGTISVYMGYRDVLCLSAPLFFTTVKTRRDSLKQPKFALRCKQLPVGLICPIGSKGYPVRSGSLCTSPARANICGLLSPKKRPDPRSMASPRWSLTEGLARAWGASCGHFLPARVL